MNIKKIAYIVLNFTINRLIEIIGISILLIGTLLFTALISYSQRTSISYSQKIQKLKIY